MLHHSASPYKSILNPCPALWYAFNAIAYLDFLVVCPPEKIEKFY